MVISQNIVIFNFLFILVTFQSGIMAFLTSIHCCPEAHWSVQTKQRKNLWTAIPAVNTSRRFNKIRKMTVFHEMVVELILLNQIKWSWYHPFQKTMFYLMKSKYAIFSSIKVMKIERSAFFFLGGDTRYMGNNIYDYLCKMSQNWFTQSLHYYGAASLYFCWKVDIPHEVLQA